MEKAKHALLIYNPTVRSSADPDLWLGAVIHRLCHQANYYVTVIPTHGADKPPELIEAVRKSPELLVAAGGDGTIRLCLETIVDTNSNVTAGIIPVGTGNQLARNLGLYEDSILTDPLELALNTLIHGNVKRIDLGKMNNNFFTVAAGAGPMSDAVTIPARDDKTNWKMLAYAATMVKTFAMPPVVFMVTADGNAFQVAASGIFVSNVAELGVGTMSETAKLDDGLLDLCILNPTSFTDYLELGFRFGGGFFGGDAPYYIRKIKTVDITVVPIHSPMSKLQHLGHHIRNLLQGKRESKPPILRQVAAMIDGDPCGNTPMHIEVVPQAVNVLVPRHSDPSGINS